MRPFLVSLNFIALILATGLPVVFCADASGQTARVQSASHSPRGVKVVHATFQQRSTTLPPRPNHVWRHTDGGWQQIPMEPKSLVHVLSIPDQRPGIHPFSVASLTLLLALAAMTWASNEWDWDRLVSKSNPRKKKDG